MNLEYLFDRLLGKAPKDAKRHPDWNKFRKDVLDGACCAVCGGTKKLQLHHKIPFHLAPELELERDNVIPLCMAGRFGIKCHLLIGHLGNWQRFNTEVETDSVVWNKRLESK